jgi:Xaa-Pro aminopeptidase
MSRNDRVHQAERYAARRRAAFRAACALEKIEAVLISKPTDARYLSGLVEGCEGLLIGRGWATLYTHKMFRDRAPLDCPGLDIAIPEDVDGAMARELSKRKVRRLGLQGNVVTLERHRELLGKMSRVTLRPLPDFVSRVRIAKDAEEIRLTRKAVRIAEQAFRDLIAGGARSLIGRTERQIAMELDFRMRELGALGPAFEGGQIIASGPNSAALHHTPTNRRIREGDVLLIDWGAEVEGGYRSDQTRTLFMRRVPSRLAKIYPVVLEAYRRGVAAVRAGRVGRSVDQAARKYIVKEGYGEEFRHGLGHGVGLDVHEFPILSRHLGRLPKGALITIEPGIYFIGYGGVRLEDMVHVANGRGEVLNRLPLDLKSAVLR